MTRFARAKGSKSSNEKKPEDATPWSEIKNSMLSKKLSEPEKVTEKEIKVEKSKQTQWASLGDDFNNSVFLIKEHLSKTNEKSKVKKNNSTETKVCERKRKSDNFGNEENSNKELHIKRIKKQQKSFDSLVVPDLKESKLKKKNKERKLTEDEVSPAKEKKFPNNEIGGGSKTGSEQNKNAKYQKFNKTNSQSFKKANFKPKPGKQFNELQKRKTMNNQEIKSVVEELIVNGERIPIVKFQGFNVTLEDAERLKKLKSKMRNEGIPKAKLDAAIKLERRRAEKALQRLKKSVCFHCRGHGHLLSNCPNLTEKENTATGICYKCGSTEHSAAQCKVVQGTQYQFAECFICREQGHIARQCPDNPRGLYPQGGACRECGDVTHLRKDCPQVQVQKAEEVITVGLRNDRDLECLDEEIFSRKIQNSNKKVKKQTMVKF